MSPWQNQTAPSAAPEVLKTPPPRTLVAVLLLLITLAGLGVRLAGVTWGQGYRWVTIGDEIEAYAFALDYGHGQGPGVYLGQPNAKRGSKVPGPVWSFFWLNGLRLGDGPEGLLLLVALLNTAAIPMTYGLGRRLLGPAEGLWAAAFLALSPWPVCFAVGLWNPNLTTFLGAGLFLALAKVLTEDRSRASAAVVLLLALLPQIHLIGLFLVLPSLVLLLLSRTRLNWAWLGLGLSLAILAYLPYLRQEAALDWHNTRWLLAGAESRFHWGALKVLIIPLVLVSNWGLRWTTAGLGDYLSLGGEILGSPVLLLLLNLASLAWAGWSFYHFGREVRAAWPTLWRRPRQALAERPGLVVILLLAGGSLLLFCLSGDDYQERYGAILLPLLCLLPGWAATRLGLGRTWRGWLTAGLVLLLLANAGFILGFYRHQAGRLASETEFLASFRNMEAIRQALIEEVGWERRLELRAGVYAAAVGERTEPARNAKALARYVNLREAHDRRATRWPGFWTLHLLRPQDLRPEDRAVWSGHGLVVALPAESRPAEGPWAHNSLALDEPAAP